MSIFRHKVRGTFYRLLGRARVQAPKDAPMQDDEQPLLYMDIDALTLSVRREDEFFDGRFEQVGTRPDGAICQCVVCGRMHKSLVPSSHPNLPPQIVEPLVTATKLVHHIREWGWVPYAPEEQVPVFKLQDRAAVELLLGARLDEPPRGAMDVEAIRLLGAAEQAIAALEDLPTDYAGNVPWGAVANIAAALKRAMTI